jgi:hypothetical protein
MSETYEDMQSQANGPGVEEWKRADKARANLTEFYRGLQDDPRISDLARSEKLGSAMKPLKPRLSNSPPRRRLRWRALSRPP